jgi:hypothetical protein
VRAVVPVVGSTAGAFGADFKTELQLHNPGNTVLTGRLVFRAQGIPGGPTDPQLEYLLGPSETKYFSDVVGAMGASGLGSMDVIPTSGSGVPTVVFRAFDDQASGTTGVTVPMVLVENALSQGRKAALLGPMNLEQFRFNIGVRSLGEGASIRVRLFNADGSLAATIGDRTYAPDLFEQRTASDFLGRAIEASQTVEVEVLSGRVIVYGTITDNRTNDGSIQMDPSFNAAPVVETLINATTVRDEPVTVTVGVTDPDDHEMTYAIGTGPAAGSVGPLVSTVTGFSLTYTPAAGFTGTDSFTIVIEDEEGERIVVQIRVEVTQTNTAPTATSSSVVTDEDMPVTFELEAFDTEGDALTVEITSGPGFGTLTGSGLSRTYTPSADYNGSDSFSFRVSDGELWSELATVSITINPINDAPVATGTSLTTNEDTPGTATVSAIDADGDSLTWSVVAAPAHGTISGTGPQFTYTPNPDFYGSDAFTVRANDGTVDSNVATVSVTVTAVNDAPSFTGGTAPTVLEDSGAQSVAGFATAISAGPNEAMQTVGFNVTANTNAGLFSALPAIAADGTLTYTPAPDANGSAQITVVAQDDGGTAHGGVDTSAPYVFTINVTAVNDAPTFTAGAAVTVLEDSGAYSAGWATAISPGPADEAGQTVSFAVSNDNNGLFSVQPSLAADGTLTFTPAADAFGSATVTIVLSDNGGTANGGIDTAAPVDLVITVSGVNDVPSFTAGPNVTVLEDSGAYSAAWASGISAGAGEATQTVDFLVSNDNTALFSAQPAVAADGTLSFTPAADANGAATVSVRIHDDGGTADGGVDTSAVQTFVITVTAVNDAPSFTKGPDQSTDSTSGALVTVVGWATSLSAGPPDESTQTLAFNVTGNTDTALFTTQPSVSADGTLTYATVADAQGSATITVNLSDDGGTADGGADTSAPQTFVISVDAAPRVTATTPADGTASVSPAAAVVISFSEPVEATASSFSIDCGGPVAFTLSASPASSFTLTPTTNLPLGATCQVTVFATGIEDTDTFDPPSSLISNFLFGFSVAAPSGATSTITADSASIVADGTSTSTITVQLKDGSGTNLTTSGGTVALFTTAGTLSAVTDNADGTYTATLTSSTTAGSATVTGTINGATIADDEAVTFVAGAATQLGFTVQPTDTVAGVSISPSIAVAIQDAFGNTVTSATDNVTIAIATNPAGGTLSGTATVAASAGVATFADLSIDKAGSRLHPRRELRRTDRGDERQLRHRPGGSLRADVLRTADRHRRRRFDHPGRRSDDSGRVRQYRHLGDRQRDHLHRDQSVRRLALRHAHGRRGRRRCQLRGPFDRDGRFRLHPGRRLGRADRRGQHRLRHHRRCGGQPRLHGTALQCDRGGVDHPGRSAVDPRPVRQYRHYRHE